MIVVIAEKPSVARDLARVMGAGNRREGFIEGNGYAFTWAFGHLVQLAPPQAYGYAGWSVGNLPMLPEKFILQARQEKTKGGYKEDAGVKKQLEVIKNLFLKSSEIIVATDAGREGELIFRYIYNFLDCKKPFKRLWISSQTDKAIKDGFAALKDGRLYDTLFYSARSRSEADWLVGMNATQALSLSAGNKGVLSLGRVQTPTLAMICQRFLENKNFVPETYFQVRIDCSKEAHPFYGISEKNFKTREEAEKVLAATKAAGKALVEKVEKKEKKEPPPLLYDLTSLQQDANKRHGFSADKTLGIAQDLYESKLITYPRTGSRYIGKDTFAGIPKLIENAALYPFFSPAANYLKTKTLNKRSVNDDKVTDHHALLPTENKPGNLSGDHRLIYELVVGRMLEAFHEACVKELTTVSLQAGYRYLAKGTVIRVAGWRSVFNIQEENDNDEAKEKLPVLLVGEVYPILKAAVLEKQTKPKPLHTEASLLKAMETCGKEIEDEELRQAMKESGLGTPATRAAIIEILFSREYIERQKKSIMPTAKGMAVYELVKEKSIAQPVLTGQWEEKLEKIRAGKILYDGFIGEIRDYTRSITAELLQSGGGFKMENTPGVVAGAGTASGAPTVCPKCKKGTIRIMEKFAGCSDYKNGCDFKVWRTVAGKTLTENQVNQLVAKGVTGIIKGFKSKAGKSFDAKLRLQNGQVLFDFN